MYSNEFVIRVIDGDTFETGTRRIRLADVNAPELRAAGGVAAKRQLESLILGKYVSIRPVLTRSGNQVTSYDRIVAHVEVGGVSVNQSMINYIKK